MAASPSLIDSATVTHMDEDLATRFKSFTLTDEEQGEILLSQDDVVESMSECRTSLLGKVISQKPPNLVGLRNTMEKVWGNPKNFRVLAVADGVYQFIFPSELDASRVLRGKPWFFNNHFLNLERWQPNKAIKDYSFASTPMWIQAWGLPLQFLSKDVGVKLGLRFGDVDEVTIPQSGSREGRYIRIRTVLDATQPLKRGCMLKFPNESPIWVEFRYEKLPSFCRYFGKVGHEFLGCDKRFLDMEDEVFRPAEYGIWLRASPATQQGRRYDSGAPAGRSGAEESNSISGESLADNQGSKSRNVNANSNSNLKGSEDISNSIDKSRDSAHEEMLTEAFTAERSVVFSPHPYPELTENQLTPYLEHILAKFSKPVTPQSAQSGLAQPSSKTITTPPLLISTGPPKPKLSLSAKAHHLPDSAHLRISSPSSLILSNPPVPINPLSTDTHSSIKILTDFTTSTLIDIPVANAPLARKSHIKHSSSVFAPICNHRRVLGAINGNPLHTLIPSPTPKSILNPNGKRSLENQNPSFVGIETVQRGSISATQKKARSMYGVAPMKANVDAAMVEETSLKWSPTGQ
ncbi:hypothetical protein Vadar_022597 [Vaccinium darrowii]|uniref:Uncharacterized protein n=1 Tax=Vaccinium darrowii TaxID=229202 RepID=A0ACB7YFC9_9ERIC|nr:hypothetical protein Vadar_022597 [Vaccinium darrowii]